MDDFVECTHYVIANIWFYFAEVLHYPQLSFGFGDRCFVIHLAIHWLKYMHYVFLLYDFTMGSSLYCSETTICLVQETVPNLGDLSCGFTLDVMINHGLL